MPSPTPSPTPEDAEPPQVVEPDFEPKAINADTLPQQVTVRVRLRDGVSGVYRAALTFNGPSGGKFKAVYFEEEHRVSGDEQDGVYVNSFLMLPQDQQGVWRLSWIDIVDGVRNQNVLRGEEAIVSQGFPTALLVADEVHAVCLPFVGRAP